jgi:hypothetical protein
MSRGEMRVGISKREGYDKEAVAGRKGVRHEGCIEGKAGRQGGKNVPTVHIKAGEGRMVGR